ncbi:DBH-like monooxygenase protein 2 homolog [Paramacrobiotus metropolitanus]|uniref:DBH-like monooxygenase protein 2 homolog n=1 Tax=Paramacrobiotus metropolitanus TaxID=2943436 RepID=UPI00244636C6|nr:DBH-like monooxygenase protein 2 homolog [Paramacrobiotus metropolitanus]
MWTTVVTALWITAVYGQMPPQAYPYNVTLNGQNAKAEWRKVGEDRIEFQVTAPTTGWFGLGLSPSGSMRGADILVGWIDENGKGHIEDRYAPDFIEPTLDPQQDWTLEGSVRQDGNLIFRMSRKLNTCDKQNDVPINTIDTMRLIYASNPALPMKTGDQFHIRKHVEESKGVQTVRMFEDTARTPPQPAAGEDIQNVKFMITENQVPAVDTAYVCEVMPFPPVDNSDLYMIGFGEIVTPGNTDLVHHIILYACNDQINATFPAKRQFDCDTDKDGIQGSCTALLAAVGKASRPAYFPEDVALPLKKIIDKKSFLMMQMHYDNPSVRSDRIDASGVELYLSNKKRKYDAGATRFGSIGLDWTVAIPPMTPEWTIRTECPAQCTKRYPSDGVRIIGVELHTHLLGIKMYARHIRNGKELAPISTDENYDSNYQEFIMFDKNNQPQLMPGDTVVVDCVYSSTKPPNVRTNTTFGGESTREEMCIVFAFYYPAVDLNMCMSKMDDKDLAAGYKIPASEPLTYANRKNLMAFIDKQWTPETKEKMREVQNIAKQTFACPLADKPNGPEGFGSISGIDKYEPYHDPDVCGSSRQTRSSANALQPGLTFAFVLFLRY